MFDKTKIALSLAVLLGIASAASAATKHPIHHQSGIGVQQQAATVHQGNGAFRSYGYSRAPDRLGSPYQAGTNFLSSGCGLDGC